MLTTRSKTRLMVAGWWRATPVRPRQQPYRHQCHCPSQFLVVSIRTLNFLNLVQQRTNPDLIPVPDPVPVLDLVPVLIPDPLFVPDLSPFLNCHSIPISFLFSNPNLDPLPVHQMMMSLSNINPRSCLPSLLSKTLTRRWHPP